MRLEWDEAKRLATLADRGADFADVAHLDWDRSLTRDEIDWDADEVRHVTIGPLRDDGRLHVVVWRRRGDALRVISFRRAKPKEEERYRDAWGS